MERNIVYRTPKVSNGTPTLRHRVCTPGFKLIVYLFVITCPPFYVDCLKECPKIFKKNSFNTGQTPRRITVLMFY